VRPRISPGRPWGQRIRLSAWADAESGQNPQKRRHGRDVDGLMVTSEIDMTMAGNREISARSDRLFIVISGVSPDRRLADLPQRWTR
jgi:hypothetical protein